MTQLKTPKRFNVITPPHTELKNILYWQGIYERKERELIIDNFAGGGGASVGIEEATGASVDVAINHDPDAISMHRVNHPDTVHYCENVWHIDPRLVARGRPVGLVWLSPDCRHFSKAKGGTPVEKQIRGLAWIAVRWAATVKPRVIILENVEEFKTWGPLIQNGQGEWIPDPHKKGKTFNSFVKELQKQGYEVEWKELRACDYGAPTVRKRLFLIARCDGQAIVWPEASHAAPGSPEVLSGARQPWRTAESIIDWSIPGRTIFGRKKPLAGNTLRRIFRGLEKYIIQVADCGGVPFLAPYLVKVNHQGEAFRGQALQEPLQTITAKNGWGLVTPYIVRIGQTGFGKDRLHSELVKPLTTVTSKAEHTLVCPVLVQVGYGEREGQAPRVLDLHKPIGTVTAGGNKFAVATARLMEAAQCTDPDASFRQPVENEPQAADLVSSYLVKLRGTCKDGQAVTDPVPTITAGGFHIAEVRAFLAEYMGAAGEAALGLLTIRGIQYQIIDIHFRMLQAHELFAAQGFPPEYQISVDAEGRKYSQKDQVARCGNAVPPPFAKALVKSNLAHLCVGAGRSLSLERYHIEPGQLAFSI